MTVIVAVRDGSVVLMAADSAGTDANDTLQIRKDPKIFKQRVRRADGDDAELVIGFAGDWGAGQALAVRFRAPMWTRGSAFEYLVQSWVPAAQRMARHESRDAFKDLTLLIGLDAQIFKIYEDGQVAQSLQQFDAVNDIALGAIAAGWDAGLRSWELLEATCKITEGLCSTVRGPFHFVPCFRSY